MPNKSREDSSGSVPKGVGGPGSIQARIGQYELCSENGKFVVLGKGGFGKTYLAKHAYLGKKVAIKVIHDVFSDEEVIKKRFFNEARALAEFDHPHIARIVDYGEDDGRLYYAMEFGDGGDLEKRVSTNGPLTQSEALKFTLQAANALAYVHGQGMLHRDLKPANFIFCSKSQGSDDWTIKLIDFGLVKRLEAGGGMGLTQSGQSMLSLSYASPEQIQNKVLDARSDIFSLGLTLWFMLAGRSPFGDHDPTTVALERARPECSYDARLPGNLEHSVWLLLADMVAFDPDKRPASMGEVKKRIEACIQELKRGFALFPIVEDKRGFEEIFELCHKLEGLQVPAYDVIGKEDNAHYCARWFAPGVCRDHPSAGALRRAIARLCNMQPPYFLRPVRLLHMGDCDLIVEESGGDLTLKALVTSRKGLSIREAQPILQQLAVALESINDLLLVSASLRPDQVFVSFAAGALADFWQGTPSDKPVSKWPPFLVRLRLDYRIGEQGADAGPLSGGATVMTSLDQMVQEGRIPQFAAIMHYLLAARHPIVGTKARTSYVRIPALSEAGNDLLRDALSGTAACKSCQEFLGSVVAREGLGALNLIKLSEVSEWVDYRVQHSPGKPDVQSPPRPPPGEQPQVPPQVDKPKKPKPSDPPKPRPPSDADTRARGPQTEKLKEKKPSSRRSHPLIWAAAGALLGVVAFLAMTMKDKNRGAVPEKQDDPLATSKVEPNVSPPPLPPPPPTPPYKIVLDGHVEPPNAIVLLGGKPLSSWGEGMPPDFAFPAKLSVNADGYGRFEEDVRPESADRVVKIKLPTLVRSSGSLVIKTPPEGVDYPLLKLSWVGPLPGEDSARQPDALPEIKLSEGASSTSRLQVSLPTGVYQAVLNGSAPRVPDRSLDEKIQIKSAAETIFTGIPPTMAGLYTCEFDFGVAPKVFHIKRTLTLSMGLSGGSAEEIVERGPPGMIDKDTGKKIVFPASNTHAIRDLRFDSATGISGTILKRASGGLADEKFRVQSGQIYFEPISNLVAPFNVPVTYRVPSGGR